MSIALETLTALRACTYVFVNAPTGAVVTELVPINTNILYGDVCHKTHLLRTSTALPARSGGVFHKTNQR